MMLSCRLGKNSTDHDLLLHMELERFNALVAQATHVIGQALGLGNTFNHEINMSVALDKGGQFGKPSFPCVNQVDAYVRAAATQIGRKEANPPKSAFAPPAPEPYVNRARIAMIEGLSGGKFDFAKLAQLCKELNTAHASDSHYSVGMLVRAITDHVPPVFGMNNFPELAASYGSGSFKKSMQNLQGSLRNIANALLHQPIRPREAPPTAQQVDFKPDLDVLLSEIIRIVEPKKIS